MEEKNSLMPVNKEPSAFATFTATGSSTGHNLPATKLTPNADKARSRSLLGLKIAGSAILLVDVAEIGMFAIDFIRLGWQWAGLADLLQIGILSAGGLGTWWLAQKKQVAGTPAFANFFQIDGARLRFHRASIDGFMAALIAVGIAKHEVIDFSHEEIASIELQLDGIVITPKKGAKAEMALTNLNDKWHIQDAVIQYAIYWNIPHTLSALCESERKKMLVGK